MSTRRKPVTQMWDVGQGSASNANGSAPNSNLGSISNIGQDFVPAQAGYQMPMQAPQQTGYRQAQGSSAAQAGTQGDIGQPDPPATTSQQQPNFSFNNMFLDNPAIQAAIEKYQQEQSGITGGPVDVQPEVSQEPVVEPPPPAAPNHSPMGFEPGGILAGLYGGNASQSERLTNGLNYAVAPQYAPNPKSSGSWFEDEGVDEGGSLLGI